MTTKQVYEADRLKHPERYSDLREGISAPKIFVPATPAKRIRQTEKPLMNKLEAEWHERIKDQFPNYPPIRIQAMRFRLSRSSWYKPDFTVTRWPQPQGPATPTAWEVKGPHAYRGGLENLKMAATAYPEWRWLLVWKENGEWKEQVILP